MRQRVRRIVSRTPAPDVKSWEYDHELCLLSGLREARRDGRFNPSAEAYRQQDLQDLLVLLNALHEGYVWELKSVENKCKDLKEFWSAFKAAKDFTGATFDSSDGGLNMDERKEALLMKRGHPYIYRIIISGLTTDDEITYEAWEEIFSKDQPIASRGMDKAAATKEDALAMRVGNLDGTTIVDPLNEDTQTQDLLLASDSEEGGSSSEASTLSPLSPVSRLKLPSSTVSSIIKARKQKAKKRAEKRQGETKRLLGALH